MSGWGVWFLRQTVYQRHDHREVEKRGHKIKPRPMRHVRAPLLAELSEDPLRFLP